MSKPIIEVKNISKKYVITKQKESYLSLRDEIVRFCSGKAHAQQEEFWALKDVSFDINPGESIGIIGRNGAGKSTLLRILAQITPPTHGEIILRGRVASLLEVGTGFHPELSGRENIFLNGALLGMSHREIRSKFDEIVDFAGVEKFLDTPVKRYSSGMYMRLAFAVAIHLESEIMLIDEVMAVADIEFQKKCLKKMEHVSKGGKTMVFVSHQMNVVSQVCKDIVLLEKGNYLIKGVSEDIISIYLKKIFNTSENGYVLENKSGGKDKDLYIKRIYSFGLNAEEKNIFQSSEEIRLKVIFNIIKPEDRVCIGFFVRNSQGAKVFSHEYNIDHLLKKNVLQSSVVLSIPCNTFVPGEYVFTFGIYVPNLHIFDWCEDAVLIKIFDSSMRFASYGDYGSVFVDCKWTDSD